MCIEISLQPNTDWDQGLASNRKQALSRANAGLAYWRIYASQGHSWLTFFNFDALNYLLEQI